LAVMGALMAMAGKAQVIIPRKELEAFWATHGVMQTHKVTAGSDNGDIALRLYKRQPTSIDPRQATGPS
jgi:hypothetical protein